MNRISSKINRSIVLVFAVFVIACAFVWTRSSASERGENKNQTQENSSLAKEKTDRETSETSPLKTEKRGFPLINLQDGKKLETELIASDGEARTLGAARPQAMIDADLNLDGAADLIVGYADGGGAGYLVLHQGSLDTLSARTPEIFEGMKEGRFPAPFLSQAGLIKLPIEPDFIGAGDFNRDGWKDIVVAARGGNSIVLLAGSERGDFALQNKTRP